MEREETQQRTANGNGDGAAPDGPTDIKRGGWGSVLKRTVKEFRQDNLTDWAAALTYYGVLALFPALVFLVSILGLVGPSATQPLIQNLTALAPSQAKDIVNSALTNIQHARGAAGVAFVIGLVLALWSASGYIGAFIRASNAIYEVPEGRPFWKLRPLQHVVMFIMVMLLDVSELAV